MRELSDGAPPPETITLQFGRPVEGSDGQLGQLTDVVVKPDERRVSHLVVEDQAGEARLVPAGLLVQERGPSGAVVLELSASELAACDSIRSFSYGGLAGNPRENEGTEVGVEDVVVMPSFGALAFGDYAGDLGGAYGVTYDSIPAGSAELRHESVVVSESQEMLGTVHGLLVSGQRLTHVVVQRTEPRDSDTAAIPIDSVVAIDTDCVTVALSAVAPAAHS